jgi:hypothetical protein
MAEVYDRAQDAQGKRQSQVQAELNALASLVDQVGKATEQLINRLEPITRPFPPIPGNEPEKHKEQKVQLASHLSGLHDKLRLIQRDLMSILDCLEL